MASIAALVELVKVTIKLAQTVRTAVAVLKGESKVVVNARKLMHSCQMYEDCLLTMEVSLKERSLMIETAGIDNSSTQRSELQKSLILLNNQLIDDGKLLHEILDETKGIDSEFSKFKVLDNIQKGIWFALTHKSEEVKELECQLMNRVQIITALMMKDVWKSSNGFDIALMDSIGDIDGSLFWSGHFGSERKTSFRALTEAYQSYIMHTFLLHRFSKAHVTTILRHTMFEDNIHDDDLMRAEITVKTFGLWLKRYGPMKDTLSKASALSLASSGRSISCFYPSVGRDNAKRIIEENLSCSKVGPDDLFVIRYSNDPKYQFVITTKPPSFKTVEHYTVMNGPLGYFITGQEQRVSSNILECVQNEVLNRLFVGMSVTLSNQSINQWEDIIAQGLIELPSDHYKSVDALNEAAENATRMIGESNNAIGEGNVKGPIVFRDVFNIEHSATDNKIKAGTGTGTGTGASLVAQTDEISSSSFEKDEKIVVGKYMILHGLNLLRESKRLDTNSYLKIMDMIKSV